MKFKKLVIMVFGLFIICLSITYLAFQKTAIKESTAYTYQSQKSRESSIVTKNLHSKMTLAAIGDILIHDRVYNDAKSGIEYRFDPMLALVKNKMQEPDLLLANLESIVAGKQIGLSSYPIFNSPQEIADTIKDAGVDIVTTANNHALDRGVKAQKLSLDYLKEIELPHVGTAQSREEQEGLTILSKNGIKIAFLSYTYGLNGIPIPTDYDYIVNVIDEKEMIATIQQAKKEADVIVMGIHWGTEYQRLPSIYQRELAQLLVNEGVDIIFGSHPHVLQPMEWLYNKEGDKSLVVYSLGNYLSGQKGNYRDIGGIASVVIEKSILGNETTIQLKSPSFYPTYVASQEEKNYRMYPLHQSQEALLEYGENIEQEIMNHMLSNVNK